MPLMKCQIDSKPGWKYGEQGKCYTYTSNDKKSEAAAKLKAAKQGIVINKSTGETFKKENNQ